MLEGRTLGLVGYGHIGRAVAKRAEAFGMRILVHTRTPRPDTAATTFTGRHELAVQADHIVLTATATAETRHLVDDEFLRHTRPGVHLVNVARGSLVDQDALRRFLDSGHVDRATLDTVEPEPLPADHWLRHHPRVMLSPHIAALSPLSLGQALARFTENYRRYLAGEPLQDVVSMPEGTR